MSEQTRRHTNQPSRRYTQATHQASSLNSNQPSINRSTYYGNQTDNYSSSNYRNSSNSTNTTTNPSTTSYSQSSSSSDSDVSICHSYLIAIFSSFLVVLGIYLALTKFNARYLYLSLIGLSTTAIGACIYCVSNIRASKLAKRKQRVNLNDFTLNSGNVANSNSNQLGTNTQNITTIIHILSNRTLNSINASDALDRNENVPSAISTVEDITSVQQQQPPPQHASEIRNGSQVISLTEGSNLNSNLNLQPSNPIPASRDDSIIVISENQSLVHSIACTTSTQQLSSLNQLPDNQHCQLSPGDASGDFSSSTCLIEEHSNRSPEQIKPSLHSTNTDSSITINNNDNSQVQPSTNKVVPESVNRQLVLDPNKDEIEPTERVLLSTISSPSRELRDNSNLQEEQTDSSTILIDINCSANDTHQPSISGKDVPDLINQPVVVGLMPSNLAEQQVTKRKSAESHQSRPTHLRRTLVMGLSGEEELIEIDEADLDNMSILPPSYESITTMTTVASSAKTDQQHSTPET